MKMRNRIFILRHRIFSFFYSRETKKRLNDPNLDSSEKEREQKLEDLNQKSYELIKRGHDNSISAENFEEESAELNSRLDVHIREYEESQTRYDQLEDLNKKGSELVEKRNKNQISPEEFEKEADKFQEQIDAYRKEYDPG